MKVEYFGISYFRQMLWSALSFYIFLEISRATEKHSA